MNRFKVKIRRFNLKFLIKLCWLGRIPREIIREQVLIPISQGQIRAFVYSPAAPSPRPIIIFYHGGGFVIGDIEAYDPICRDLCEKTGHIVVSIDYRLAPEFPFPAAPEDCLSALNWVIDNANKIGGDTKNIFVAGDSAGGNLAAVTAIRARNSMPELLKGQILIYPVTNHYASVTKSYIEYARGHILTRNLMIWFWDLYLNQNKQSEDSLTRHDLATPLTVKDLGNLPPALVITAELDPLRDEGEAYANRLSEANVEAQYSLYKGQRHGFFGILGPGRAHRKAVHEIAEWMDHNIR